MPVIGRSAQDEEDGIDLQNMEGSGDEEEDQLIPGDSGRSSRSSMRPAEGKAKTSSQSDEADEPRCMGLPLKWVSLGALTVQTTAQALLIRWSKQNRSAEGPRYLNSTVVLMVELTKLIASLLLVVFENGGFAPASKVLKEQFSQGWVDLLKAAVPSMIYTIQNNLMFYSLEKLSTPIQQVLYQMKVITTAGLGVLMLGKSLTNTKWCACFLLAIGVAMVQWPRESQEQSVGSDQVKGFFAVLAACFTSGFASVWIQKMLQQANSSIWVRNVQLALFGCLNGLIIVVLHDAAAVYEQGFFGGFDHRVISAILMTALGGLLCAMMLKYAGATHGCFSTAISIILTAFVSEYLLGDFTPDLLFYCGTFVAIGSTFLFTVGLPDFLTRLLPM